MLDSSGGRRHGDEREREREGERERERGERRAGPGTPAGVEARTDAREGCTRRTNSHSSPTKVAVHTAGASRSPSHPALRTLPRTQPWPPPSPPSARQQQQQHHHPQLHSPPRRPSTPPRLRPRPPLLHRAAPPRPASSEWWTRSGTSWRVRPRRRGGRQQAGASRLVPAPAQTRARPTPPAAPGPAARRRTGTGWRASYCLYCSNTQVGGGREEGGGRACVARGTRPILPTTKTRPVLTPPFHTSFPYTQPA